MVKKLNSIFQLFTKAFFLIFGALFNFKIFVMSISKDQLEKFIETVLEIKNSKRSVIHDSKDLKEIAFEMGFTEEDWKDYLREYQKQLTAGRSFLEHKNPDDAASHLEKAISLNPYGLEANALLAETYKQKYLNTKNKAYKQKALDQARKCLQIDNKHAASYQLITELKQTGKQASNKQIIIVATIIFLIISAFVMFFTKSEKAPAPSEADYGIVRQTPAPVETETPEPEIKTVFINNDKASGLTFISDLSELSNYNESYSYKLHGFIQPEGIELEALKLKLEALDSEGRILFTDYIEPVQSHYQAYRSGDLIPVYFLKYAEGETNPDINTIRLSVQTLRKEAAAEPYEASRAVDYIWAYERPPNYNVEIKERYKSLSGNYTDKVYCKLSLEAENTGNTAISTLQTEIEWCNKKDEIVESKTAYFTTSSYPKIRRGQMRIYSGTWLLPMPADDFKSYKIKITDVR